MTADELASFRALLRAQVEAPQRRPRFFAPRERATAMAVAVAAPAPEPLYAPAPTLLTDAALHAVTLADPPPRAPPRFGRRELEAPAPVGSAASSATEPLMLRTALASSESHVWEVPQTAPEAEPLRPPAVASPGGWTRARPPSAQRRLLARLEAVFLAERLGLDARRESQRG